MGKANDHWPRPLDRALITAALDPDEGRARAALARVRAVEDLAAIDHHNRQGVVNLTQRFPKEDLGPLRDVAVRVRKHAWAFQQKTRAEIGPLLAAMTAAGVRVMLIKGSGLLERYRRAGLVREMADWDVLIDPADDAVAKVHRVFDARWAVPSLPVFREALTAWHSANFFRDPVVQIDLHTDLVRYRARRGGGLDPWRGALEDRSFGRPVATPSAEVSLFLAMINGSAPNHEADVNPSRWLYDVDLLLRTGTIDWDLLHREAVARDVVKVFDRVAALYEDAVGRTNAIPRVSAALATASDPKQEDFHEGRQFTPWLWFHRGSTPSAKLRRFWAAFKVSRGLRLGVDELRAGELTRLPLFFAHHFQVGQLLNPRYWRRRRLARRATGE